MSTELTRLESDRFAETVLPLLKEYSEKLKQFGNDVVQIRNDCIEAKGNGQQDTAIQSQHFSVLEISSKSLFSAANKCARQVSQYLEHGDIDDIARIAVEIRLAEFEQAIDWSQRMIQLGLPR